MVYKKVCKTFMPSKDMQAASLLPFKFRQNATMPCFRFIPPQISLFFSEIRKKVINFSYLYTAFINNLKIKNLNYGKQKRFKEKG